MANAESETEKFCPPTDAAPVDTALVLELLAAQLRAGLAPLAALGTSPRRSTAERCTRSASAYRWVAIGERLVGVRGGTSVSCGMHSPRLHGRRTQHGTTALADAHRSANAARQNAPPESLRGASWYPSGCAR